jgi:hypothetical protein
MAKSAGFFSLARIIHDPAQHAQGHTQTTRNQTTMRLV